MTDYNINAVTRRVVFTGSAGTGPYSFTFEVLDQNDLAVYFNTTKLTLTTDYTVSIAANGTGSVTIVVGTNVPTTPDADDTIIIVGARDIERTTDFVTAGDLRASALNEQLDGLTIFDQQIAEEQKRTLQAPVYDPAHVDDGGTLDMTLPAKAARAGKYLQFNSTTGNPEAGPDSTDVTALADVATDIATLADIEDGTDATDAIQTVAGISSNVTTVAGVAANVSTVAGISSDVTAVAADATDIGTVATNIASVNTVAGNISEVIAVANDLNEAVSEVETVANDLNEAVSEIETVAASISNVDTVGTNIANVNTVAGIDSNVTTVAGISADVTTVAGINGNVTTVAGISADVTTVAADGTDIGTIATNIANVNTVAGISSNVTTVAGNNANVTTVATNIANVNTVATNIADVNNFSSTYRIAASAPTTSLDEGDLYFNTTDNQMYVYTGSAWNTVSPDLVGDTTPQLGGNLDVNGNDITGTGDINITGTVTADGLTVDGDATVAGTVGVTADSGTITTGKDSASTRTHWRMNNPNGEVAKWDSNGTDLLHYITDEYKLYTAGNKALEIDGNGDISFYDSTGVTQGLFWDASTQRLGLGTTAPNKVLHLETSGETVQRMVASTTNLAGFYFGDSGNGSIGQLIYDNANDSMRFNTNGGERVRITSGGNVGIGTSSPAYALHVSGTNPSMVVESANTSGSFIQFRNTGSPSGINRVGFGANDFVVDTNNSERLRIDSSGNVGIGTSSPTAPLHIVNSSTPRFEMGYGGGSNGDHRIAWDSSGLVISADQSNQSSGASYLTMLVDGSEAMRIDSSGNLLVGKTSSSGSIAGAELRANGRVFATANGVEPLFINRLSSDGELVSLRKDGTEVGSIGAVGGSVYIASPQGTDAGLQFGNSIVGPASTTGANRDNAIDLGWASNRFDDIYATNGTIQTSDANEKQDIEELSDAEQRVAVAAKGLLRKYRWKDSVAEKGDDARIHFGIIAQDLKAAFEAEGLDAGRYAMFINSEWTDEETGEQKSRMGIRYNQLLAFIIAAI